MRYRFGICEPPLVCIAMRSGGVVRNSYKTARQAVGAVAIAMAVTVLAGCTTGAPEVITQSLGPTSSIPSATGPSTTASESDQPPNSAPATSQSPSGTEVGEPTTPWPADFTPEQQRISQAALAAITGFTGVVAQANADPGQDWTARIRTYAADPAAKLSLQSIQSLATAGVHATSPSSYEDPAVLSAGDIRAVVDICVNRSQATLVDAAGVTVLGPPEVPRTVVTYTVVKYAPEDGGWLVTETASSDPVRQC